MPYDSSQLPSKVEFKNLRTARSGQKSTKSRIEAEIDPSPFDFDNAKSAARESTGINNSLELRAALDEELYMTTDVFERRQLPNMSDFAEGVNYFLS